MITVAALVVLALAGYLIGSIPFGIILTRLGGAGDLRAIGSGNIGATNVLRTGRKDLALTTLLTDGGKGAVAVAVAILFTGPQGGVIAGACAFLGHLFPVWLRFRGGKGVATFFGVLLAAAWPVGILAGATWLLTAAVFRYSSLAALAAAVAAPLIALALHRGEATALALFMGALIFIRHGANIRRLLAGEEPRIGAATPGATAA